MAEWYPQSIPALKKLAEDDVARQAMQARLAEIQELNKSAIRCAMSKALERKLTEVLG